MATLSVEQLFGSMTSYNYVTGTYNQDQLGLGLQMMQNNGATEEEKWIGPRKNSVARPVESSSAAPGIMPFVIPWSTDIHWIFLADNATATTTRRILMYTYTLSSQVFAYIGLITMAQITSSGNRTIRALRMTYDKYTTGTASVNATAVTGTNTTWTDSRLCVGSRIGFGSTDPTQITTWYEISAIGSNTGITLTTSAGSIADCPYVIEELRAYTLESNVTANFHGIHVAKGLRPEIFLPSAAGTTIPLMTADNTRATCVMVDLTSGSTLTSGVFGLGLQAKSSWTEQFAWAADVLANPVLYKFNLRAALTFTAGKTSSAYVFKTGSGGAVTGTTSQNNNGRVAIAGHGGGSGVPCFYFTTTSRAYRTDNLNNVTTGSTVWLSGGDVLVEVPSGGTYTYNVTGAMSTIDYSDALDVFLIATTSKMYYTKWKTDSSQLDRTWCSDTKQIYHSGANGNAPLAINSILGAVNLFTEGGVLYFCTTGTTNITNFLLANHYAADFAYAAETKARIVCPRILLPNCNKLKRVIPNNMGFLGGIEGQSLGMPTEPYLMYYRTTGISDDSGTWTYVITTGDISVAGAASEIQFMFEFKLLGANSVPERVMGLAVIYEDLSTDGHYQPSVAFSDRTNKKFAWRFSTAFGSNVPILRVRLYDAVTNGVLLSDTTSSPTGTFEKSTDNGGSWVTWTNADKANETTYLRYTPASLGDGIKVRALLTLN